MSGSGVIEQPVAVMLLFEQPTVIKLFGMLLEPTFARGAQRPYGLESLLLMYSGIRALSKSGPVGVLRP